MFPKAVNLYQGISGAKPGDCPCSFAFLLIFAGIWLFLYNYVSADSWDGFAEKIMKKDYFLTQRWSIEIVPEISLPPCIFPTIKRSLVCGNIYCTPYDQILILCISYMDFYIWYWPGPNYKWSSDLCSLFVKCIPLFMVLNQFINASIRRYIWKHAMMRESNHQRVCDVL